jgi:hypothetical protein
VFRPGAIFDTLADHQLRSEWIVKSLSRIIRDLTVAADAFPSLPHESAYFTVYPESDWSPESSRGSLPAHRHPQVDVQCRPESKIE